MTPGGASMTKGIIRTYVRCVTCVPSISENNLNKESRAEFQAQGYIKVVSILEETPLLSSLPSFARVASTTGQLIP